MKTLVFGPAAVGKTTLMKSITSGYDFMKIINLAPTRGINREFYLFRGLLEVMLWDAGGQEIYLERYFAEGQRERVFSDVHIPIFMADASDEGESVKKLFDRYLQAIQENSADFKKIYVLLNKVDLPEAKPDKVRELLLRGLDQKSVSLCLFTPVSVRNGTAQQRLIEILDEVLEESTQEMQKLNSIRKILDNFKTQTRADYFLFNRSDGLVITSTIGKITADPLNFLSISMGALESNIDTIFSKVSERLGSLPEPLNFNSIIYETEKSYILLKEIDDYAILLIISNEKKLDSILAIMQNFMDSDANYKNLKSLVYHK